MFQSYTEILLRWRNCFAANRCPHNLPLLRSLESLPATLQTSNPLQFATLHHPSNFRCFSSTSKTTNWLAPRRGHSAPNRKGRPKVPIGGSTRGTTVVWGDYGLRMRDHDRRISAAALDLGMKTIRQRLRGERYRLYTRVCANIGVYTSGNEVRMGKGKGKFDYWAARVPVSRIIFELKGDLHEQIVRDAFRLAGHKMPGMHVIQGERR